MALAVDTKHLLNEVPPNYLHNDSLDRADRSRGRLLQLHRVCVYATVAHDDATRAQFDERCGYEDPRQRAAQDWQAAQGDDEDEMEVLHHLKLQLAATTAKPRIRCARSIDGVDCKEGTTTRVASEIQSPMVTSCTQHRPPSPFRRRLTRLVGEMNIIRNRMLEYRLTKVMKVLPSFGNGGISASLPEIVPTDIEAHYHFVIWLVIWLVQSDCFDLSSQSTYVPSSPGKRRRTLDRFHQVSPRHDKERTTRAHDHPAPETKRFKGVRYRPDHNRWVAEMKPPKSRNKVSFGEFRSQTDAAHVVDVAFQHYGRPLNFPDCTPHILSSLPPSAGLSAEEKLKDQIKWMKSRISSLPSQTPIQFSASSQRSGPRSSWSAATTQTMPSRNHTRAGCRRSYLKCGVQETLKESRWSRLDLTLSSQVEEMISSSLK